jgi:hypothetical protein
MDPFYHTALICKGSRRILFRGANCHHGKLKPQCFFHKWCFYNYDVLAIHVSTL